MNMKFYVPYHFAKRQKGKIPMRSLTVNEINLAKSVFGELIDYAQTKIINYPYIPWQADDIFIAPNGWIFVGAKHHQEDFALCSQSYRQVFIHEMTHVLQHQQGLNVLWRGAVLQALYYLSFKIYNPYRYVFDKNKRFWDYNIEQQGRIAEHIYLGKIPNIIKSRSSPRQMESVR